MTDMTALIEPLIPLLRRYARALLRDPAAADDLVQDSLERAVSRWSSTERGTPKSPPISTAIPTSPRASEPMSGNATRCARPWAPSPRSRCRRASPLPG